MLLEGEQLGLHHEVLDHVQGPHTDKTRRRIAVLSKIRWDTFISRTGRPAAVEIIIRCGGVAGLGGLCILNTICGSTLKMIKPAGSDTMETEGRGGSSREAKLEEKHDTP
jgi:hypothetical protein